MDVTVVLSPAETFQNTATYLVVYDISDAPLKRGWDNVGIL